MSSVGGPFFKVVRLQLWCEMQLCKELTASAVCGILCQAHLHQAKELEKAGNLNESRYL